jgi:phospholipid/cholesterol/gamma-HCH transport system ATP-binding protein
MSANSPIAVEFRKVMKSFGEKRVLDNVSFQIEQGEAVCVLGRSGTGKSVTLKLIMALMRPDSGEVWVDRDNVVGMAERGLSWFGRSLDISSRARRFSTHSRYMRTLLFL